MAVLHHDSESSSVWAIPSIVALAGFGTATARNLRFPWLEVVKQT
jgi:hypothetical protein